MSLSREKIPVQPFTGPPRQAAKRSGQILVITLLAITVLVGLVFFVYNLGGRLSDRLSQQNAADAAAVSGAGWMARSMNVVAINNVTQTRLIALIAVLDALPLAAEMTIAEETGDDSLPLGLAKWQNVVPAFTVYEEDNFYRRGLAELYRQMNPSPQGDGPTHLDLLYEIDRTLDHPDEKVTEDGFDITRATRWSAGDGAEPSGTIWQAIVTLDEFSQATVESAGLLAQANAVRFGQADGGESALLVPVLPRMPARRTDFADFGPVLVDHIAIGWEYPHNPARRRWVSEVRQSNLVNNLAQSQDVAWDCRTISVRGGAIPEFAYPHRIGPFAKVYQWRGYWDRSEYDWTANRWVRQERWGYSTYGPLENALGTVLGLFGAAGWHSGTVDTSRFAYHLRSFAKVKVAYMLGLSAPQKVQYADKWILDYNEARAFAADNDGESPPPIMTTRYYRVSVKSTTHWSDRANWMKTYDPTPPTLNFTPMRYHSNQLRTPHDDVFAPELVYRWIEDRRGWHDVTAGDWEKLTDYVWIRRTGPHRVSHDYQMKLPPRYVMDPNNVPVLNENGDPITVPYEIYLVEWRVFGGIEIRQEIDLSSPVAGATPSEMPAPILIEPTDEEGRLVWYEDYETDQPLQGIRIEPFAFLGVTRKSDKAAIWPQRFSSANPTGAMVAVAQAGLFNNASWDLWTQDWRVQLQPVAQWDSWLDRMEDGIADAEAVSEMVDVLELEEIYDYMLRIDPYMAEMYLSH